MRWWVFLKLKVALILALKQLTIRFKRKDHQTIRTVGTFNNRNYYQKLTPSLGQPCHNVFFSNYAFPFLNISFLFVLLITVFLTLKKSSSYRSNKHFHTLSFLVTITMIWSLQWLYSLLILLSANFELNPGPKLASTSNNSICYWNRRKFLRKENFLNYTCFFRESISFGNFFNRLVA